MKVLVVLLAMFAGISIAQAADVEAGKTRAIAVCAACHGGNGVSVAAAIPNLAGQKAGYLTNQLQAFKDGKRKNELMNAIASQLDGKDIENVAAFFAGLPGASASATLSEFLPNVAKTRVKFPADYKASFTKYMTIDFPDRKQVRYYYANSAALKAARAGAPLPDGSVLFVEVFTVKLDEQKNPVKGGDGFFAPDKLILYTAMERQAGWGAEIPEMLRNDDWNYAVFTTDKVYRSGVNQAECLACHKPLPKDSYLFTLKQLRDVALKK